MTRYIRYFAVALLCLMGIPRVMQAQESLANASITGRVLDPSGALVPNSTVTALAVATNQSYTVQSALRFLPQEACFTLTSASEKALIYTDEDLHHRMLVLYEADAVAKA